ncbi:NUDIX hydrolase [Vibrio sp. D431a]|uniref:NUDIX hydrolase n=1 Tax=Vibrio sp. D431a TaxID=2837388 RepID=UPI00255570EE|nr:NUDIX hydrolase [Vibrio sp. D431a]
MINTDSGSTVLPITAEGEFILISTYKYAQDKHFIELPKGCRELGESYTEAAIRELEEETQFTTHELSYFSSTPTTSSIICSKSEDFIGWHCKKLAKPVKGDHTEEINEVFKLKASELFDMIQSGEIVDSGTISFVLKFFTCFYPLTPKDLDRRSSHFIQGMYNAALGQAESSRIESLPHDALGEWKDGWKYYTFKSASKK